MKRFLYELSESWKIAAAQMRSNLTRSTLTALGVIIGIIAVTLMGTAVNGISIGFDKSMAVLGDDVLYEILHHDPRPIAELNPDSPADLQAIVDRCTAKDPAQRYATGREFLVGDRYTVADIALYAYTHVAHEGGFNLVAYPNVRAWLGRVASEPGHVAITRRQFG